MAPDDLLARLAVTLRKEVGPAVDGDFARTQAFMGAVVLEKVSSQLRLAAAHAEADARDRDSLYADLDAAVGADAAGSSHATSSALRVALDDMQTDGTDTGLCRFIEALYARRGTLDEATVDVMLRRVRTGLRARIDRRMEFAR